jgi:hypothetical protein
MPPSRPSSSSSSNYFELKDAHNDLKPPKPQRFRIRGEKYKELGRFGRTESQGQVLRGFWIGEERQNVFFDRYYNELKQEGFSLAVV